MLLMLKTPGPRHSVPQPGESPTVTTSRIPTARWAHPPPARLTGRSPAPVTSCVRFSHR